MGYRGAWMHHGSGPMIEARSGGQWIPGRNMPSGCFSRVRFVAPDSDVLLTVHGLGIPSYELHFREMR